MNYDEFYLFPKKFSINQKLNMLKFKYENEAFELKRKPVKLVVFIESELTLNFSKQRILGQIEFYS